MAADAQHGAWALLNISKTSMHPRRFDENTLQYQSRFICLLKGTA